MATRANGKRAKSGANLSFRGWRRENGRVGVRNHVVILPLDDLSLCQRYPITSGSRYW